MQMQSKRKCKSNSGITYCIYPGAAVAADPPPRPVAPSMYGLSLWSTDLAQEPILKSPQDYQNSECNNEWSLWDPTHSLFDYFQLIFDAIVLQSHNKL